MSPGMPSRCHGYDVVADLARNYDFGEYVVIALTGRPPQAHWGDAVNRAMIVLGRVSVADASVHAATLSARCAAPARTVLTIGALGLIEQAHAELDMPCEDTNESSEEAQTLWNSLAAPVRDALGACPSSAHSLALDVLRAVGIEGDTQLTTVLCLARLPALAAEAQAVTAGDLRGYPMQLPDFDYTEEP